MTIYLACGHIATGARPVRAGDWVSCWSLMHPAAGCQTQRKVVRVFLEDRQLTLWEVAA